MEIEELLNLETRLVRAAEGRCIAIEGFRAFWKAYDFLIFTGAFPHDRLVEIADGNAERLGIPFGSSFSAIVWRANARMRQVSGIDGLAVRRKPT